MTCFNQTAVLIPAYKPDHRLPPYAEELLQAGAGAVVIVDDGSGDAFAPVFEAISSDERVHIIHYMPNCGKGVALRRGQEWIRDHCPQAKYIVTADSDGQHTVKDVLRLAEAVAKDPSGLWLGSRDFSQENVPPKSRTGNRLTSAVFKLLYGMWVSDTQTGLRAYERSLLPMMCAVKGDRYEYEMNVLIECANQRVPMLPLPIETVYENNNEGSHFHPIRDGLRIYKVIFAGFIKFISSSLISFLVDYGMFLILNSILKTNVPSLSHIFDLGLFKLIGYIAVATAGARIVSGVVNYVLNRKFVFKDQTSAKSSFPKYLIVFLINMALSACLTSTLHNWLGVSEKIIKLPVDLFLFIMNYSIQQRWVFRGKKETLSK